MPLEFAYASKELRNVCEISGAASKALGDFHAKNLQRTLADFRAVQSVREIPFRVLKENGDNTVSITFSAKLSIRFSCNHVDPPLGEDGNIDWSRVSRIKIEKIDLK